MSERKRAADKARVQEMITAKEDELVLFQKRFDAENDPHKRNELDHRITAINDTLADLRMSLHLLDH